jgi:hypothetical protein
VGGEIRRGGEGARGVAPLRGGKARAGNSEDLARSAEQGGAGGSNLAANPNLP